MSASKNLPKGSKKLLSSLMRANKYVAKVEKRLQNSNLSEKERAKQEGILKRAQQIADGCAEKLRKAEE